MRLNFVETVSALVHAVPGAERMLAKTFQVPADTVSGWVARTAPPPPAAMASEIIEVAERVMAQPADQQWNPRYLVYCEAAGISDPRLMLEADKERWKGGCMTGFILWIQDRWHCWRVLMGMTHDYPLGQEDHARFTAWLRNNHGEVES